MTVTEAFRQQTGIGHPLPKVNEDCDYPWVDEAGIGSRNPVDASEARHAVRLPRRTM